METKGKLSILRYVRAHLYVNLQVRRCMKIFCNPSLRITFSPLFSLFENAMRHGFYWERSLLFNASILTSLLYVKEVKH